MKKLSIKMSLLSVFFALFTISCGSIIFFSYTDSTQRMRAYLTEKVHSESNSIVVKLDNYLNPVMDAARLCAVGAETKEGDFVLQESLTLFQSNVLKVIEQVDAFYNGSDMGSVSSVTRLPLNKRVSYKYTPTKLLPRRAAFSARFIDKASPVRQEKYSYYDLFEEKVAEEESPPQNNLFSPLSRPWYVGTKDKNDAFWSDVYLYETGAVGITAAYPVFDTDESFVGVVGADVTLSVLNDFLKQNNISSNARQFIINKKGSIVAYNGMAPVSNGKEMTSLLELDDKAIKEAYTQYLRHSKSEFSFLLNDEKYIAYFINIDKPFSSGWNLGVVLPTKDFISFFEDQRDFQLLVSSIIFIFSAIVILLVSHHVANPIRVIARDMEHIALLDFHPLVTPPAFFQEIDVMNKAIAHMKTGLQSFERYVPKTLIQSLLKKGNAAALGGEKKELTVFFSDIEGFTSLSERLSVEGLMHHLTEYLDEMSHVIKENRGTIDKYIGDSIMAFWGAPEEEPDHIYYGCRTALMCREKMKELNVMWRNSGRPELRNRIGLNTGEMIVGNIGSSDRLNYTIIGDQVNLGSRLEGVNKIYGTEICASEAIYQVMKDRFLFRILDLIAVKGKEQGIQIYELMGEFSDPHFLPSSYDIEKAKMTDEAFAAYLGRNFERALELYTLIFERFNHDKTAALFIERCNLYIQSPPSEEWTGLSKLLSK